MKRILIVGGSISGLTAALELLNLGFKPTVYERRPNPKTGIVCAGGISLWALRRSGLVLPKGTVASQIRCIRIHAPDGHFWQGGCGGDVMAYALRRDKLEEGLAREVRKLGGAIKYNKKVGIQEFRRLAMRYEFIVGADGMMGVTRRALNLPKFPPEDIHIGVQQLCALPKHPGDRIDLYFGRSVAPQGYGWIFPISKGRVKVGLGIPLSEKVNPINLLGVLNKRINATPLEPPKAKLIPITKPMRNLTFGNILLVGDAGNFTDALTGGGILGAVVSAKASAKAIAEGDSKRYDKHVRWLTTQNMMRYKLGRALRELSDKELDELVWCLEGLNVSPNRMSLNIIRALLALALHKPRILTRHKVVRRMLGLVKK